MAATSKAGRQTELKVAGQPHGRFGATLMIVWTTGLGRKRNVWFAAEAESPVAIHGNNLGGTIWVCD